MRHAAPTPSTTPAAPAPPTTTVGAVHLAVADVERSAAFYRELGLELLAAGPGGAALGAGGVALVVLEERPGARPARGVTGLFHLALLLPTRADLARWLHHAAARRLPVTGLSDHFVSEALYLDDPEGNGIELYRDRPREEWESDGGELRMGTVALDLESVLKESPGGADAGMPAGTVIGHVHLKVADIAPARAFYEGVIGFDVTVSSYPSALFLSAGGYHHHLGMNVWTSAGAPAPPAGTRGLRRFAVVLPDRDALRAIGDRLEAGGLQPEELDGETIVADPSGNRVLLRAA